MALENEPFLRYYIPEDYEQMKHCVALLQDYERSMEIDRTDGSSMTERYLQEILTNVSQKNGVIFIMEYEEKILGFLSLWIEHTKDEYTTTIKRYVFISDLVVLEAHRGFHLGSRLMEAAENYAREQGVDVMRLNVLARNSLALEFYHGLGYRDYEITEIKFLTHESEFGVF